MAQARPSPPKPLPEIEQDLYHMINHLWGHLAKLNGHPATLAALRAYDKLNEARVLLARVQLIISEARDLYPIDLP